MCSIKKSASRSDMRLHSRRNGNPCRRLLSFIPYRSVSGKGEKEDTFRQFEEVGFVRLYNVGNGRFDGDTCNQHPFNPVQRFALAFLAS